MVPVCKLTLSSQDCGFLKEQHKVGSASHDTALPLFSLLGVHLEKNGYEISSIREQRGITVIIERNQSCAGHPRGV